MARQTFFLPNPPVSPFSPFPAGRGDGEGKGYWCPRCLCPLDTCFKGGGCGSRRGDEKNGRRLLSHGEVFPGKQGESRNQNRTAGVLLLRRKRQTEKNRPETSIAFGAESSLCAKKYIRFCNTYQNMGQKNRKIRKRLKIFFNITIFLHISS